MLEHTRYPTAFIDVWRLRDGTRLTLRPVLPQDAALLGNMVTRLSPTSRSNRFHGSIQGLPEVALNSMSCIDYARTMAFVITCEDEDRGEQVIADARYIVDARAADSAEFAVMVADRWQRRGLGRRAMQALTIAAQQAGLRWLHGDVRARNVPMLSLMRRCSFSCTPDQEDEDLVHAETSLGGLPWAGPVASRRQGLWRWLPWRSMVPSDVQAASGSFHVER
ncbi:GNAT family protein [Variovorax robiniae]|uniref:GNAT family protein n=1 Tax=Variovorax robiniae TaxID=1836199 RepID=A0ABU8XC99_9BURK